MSLLGLLQPPLAGVVIRADEVEVFALQGKKVSACTRMPIDGEGEQALTEAIRKALSTSGLKAANKRMAVAIPSRDVLFRFFTMPAIPKAEWDGAVQFEARRYIPFKIEGMVWDYHIVHTGAKSAGGWDGQGGAPARTGYSVANRLEVIFAAAQRDTFQRIQLALTAAGVQPAFIEPRSVSLARLMPAPDPKEKEEEGFVCLVDIEADSAHLAIVNNQLPYLARDIHLLAGAEPASAAQGDDAAAAGLAPVATPLMGPLSDESMAAERGPDERAQRLLSELSVSIGFFTREYPSANIRRVFLFGEEGAVGSWCPWLAEQLRCPVELGSRLIDQRTESPIPLPFASAVGLVRRLRGSSGASIDLLKRNVAKPVQASKTMVMPNRAELLASLNPSRLVMFAAVAVGMLASLWFAGFQQVQTERRRLDRLVASRPDAGWGLNRLTTQELQPVRSTATAQIALFERLNERSVSLAAKLDALARTLPDGVWLTGLTFRDRLEGSGSRQARLTVSGASFLGDGSQELAAIQGFEDQVKRNQRLFQGFSIARVEQINAAVDQASRQPYRTFQLSCQADRKL